MTLGQEFDAFHATVKEDIARVRELVALFREVNLGATAIGTGINTDPRYAALAVEELTRISGQPMVLATNLIEATSDMGAFVLFSGVLKRVAVKLSKICNDLRLLASGPGRAWARSGCRRCRPAPRSCPARSTRDPGGREPGRLPGHRPRPDGHHVRRGGQLQLNAFEPTIGYCSSSHADADGRLGHAHAALRGRHRGRPRALPRLAGEALARHGPRPGARLRGLLADCRAGAGGEASGPRHRSGGRAAHAGAGRRAPRAPRP